MITFDVCNEKSFEELTDWFKNIKEKTTGKIPIVLVGNKIDKENV